jgi:hypothetical protein
MEKNDRIIIANPTVGLFPAGNSTVTYIDQADLEAGASVEDALTMFDCVIVLRARDPETLSGMPFLLEAHWREELGTAPAPRWVRWNGSQFVGVEEVAA